MDHFRITFKAMGGQGEIVLSAADPARAHALAASGIAEVHRIEQKYSRYRPDSIVSRINAAAGAEPVPCDEETLALLDYADYLHAASDGLFDITSGILRQAWDFRAGRVPERGQLAPLLERVGWPMVERSAEGVRLPLSGMEIDFGGFGKEYAADRAAEVMAGGGALHGYVNLAGDIRVVGPKPDGQPWSIGIQDPRNRGKLAATLPLTGGALATSGDYERFFEVSGKRYCHILNPRTGMPVGHWRSVSLLASRAIIAGSATTIAMLKEAEALDYLAGLKTGYLAIDHLGRMHMANAPGT